QHPLTTSSGVARDHFLRGQRELDLGRFIDANGHFKEAVAADPDFAFGYLNVANTANSLAEFKSNLALAEQHAAGASEAERLQIQMVRKGFDQDLAGQLALGQQLVQKYPGSPRAWLALAGVQGGLNRNDEARASIAKALALAPRMFVAHTALGLSYVFGEPRDFDKALQHVQKAETLAPDEPGAHTSLGDVYRAQRNLDKAREEYARGHQLNPRAAIDEVNRLVASVDGMGVPDPKAAKVAALANVAVIAIHTRNQPAAEQALKQLGPVLMQQADEAANPAFRRGQDATMAYFDGWWAARRGDYAAAQQQADRIGQLLAPDKNPRKLEPMHRTKRPEVAIPGPPSLIAYIVAHDVGPACRRGRRRLDDLDLQRAHASPPIGRQRLGRHRRPAQTAPRSHSLRGRRRQRPRGLRARDARGAGRGARPGRRRGKRRPRRPLSGGAIGRGRRAQHPRDRGGVPRAARRRQLRRPAAHPDRRRGSPPERPPLLQRGRAGLQYGHRAVSRQPDRRAARVPAAGVLRDRRP